MRLFLAAALLIVCAEASAQSQLASPADGSGDRILLVALAPRLGADLPGFERGAEALALPSEPETAAGPRARGAWRGARTGFLVGAGISAVAVAGVFIATGEQGDFAPWQLTAAAAVPLTVITTFAGAGLGFARAEREQVRAPSPAPAGAGLEQP